MQVRYPFADKTDGLCQLRAGEQVRFGTVDRTRKRCIRSLVAFAPGNQCAQKDKGLLMALLGILVLFPLVAAIALFTIRENRARTVIVWASAAVIAVASIAFAIVNLGTTGVVLPFSSTVVDYICTAISVIIAVVMSR